MRYNLLCCRVTCGYRGGRTVRNDKRKLFIYARYVLSVALALIALVLMLVPCYTYITPDNGANEPVSLGDLIANSWSTSRVYAFGGGEKNDVTMGFAYTVMGLTAALALLFAVGAFSSVYALVRFLRRDRDENARKIFFITAVPNRIALCIYHALMLPIFFLPMLMPLLYDRMLMYSVALSVSPFDMVFAVLVLYVAAVVLVAVSAHYERIEDMDIFARHEIAEEQMEELEEPDVDVDDDVADDSDPYEKMKREATQEQTDRILRMLRINNDNDEENGK